jgi:hypothetical protein
METVVHVVPIDAARLIPKWPDLQIALGYRDTAIPEQIHHLLDELLPDVSPLLAPTGAFAVPPPETTSVSTSDVICGDTVLHTAPMITKRLRESSAVAFFVATIGSGLETVVKNRAQDDMVGAFILDAIASTVVELVADQVEHTVMRYAEAQGWKITNRYSPGYCGWSVAEQHKLFSFFPDNICGVSVTPSALMIPIKSISGIIGLGPAVRYRDYECSLCDLTNCYRRRESSKAEEAFE